MIHRNVLKNILKFGKREFYEKKPLSLEIRKVNSKTILTRGILPSLNIQQIKGTFYIILVEYTENIRIYSFSQNGTLLGGENLINDPVVIKKILASTKLKYHLKKK